MKQYRLYSSLANQLKSSFLSKEIVAPFKTVFQHNKVTVDKNIPINRKTKAWERDGEDKEQWFKRKFAHVHAKSKNWEGKSRSKDEAGTRDGDSRQKRFIKNRDEHQEREFEDQRDTRYNDRNGGDGSYRSRRPYYERDPVARLRPSPLHDYVYGIGPIVAALSSNKREVYTELLYHNPKERHDEIMELAKERNVSCKSTTKMLLNQLTNNNVHNGYVLKTKPLLPQEITKLGPVDSSLGTYDIVSNPFGQEVTEQFEVARKQKGTNSNPFGIYLDEISDPHNVGLIIRTAYYLGADFIVMSEKNCSKLTPVVSKSSSGAMEILPIYSTNKPVDFFQDSQKMGWKFISAVVGNGNNSSKKIAPNDLKTQLSNAPCILVFGSEGAGVRTNLITRSDFVVSLQSNRKELEKSIDSLNVSVAAGLLIQNFTT